MKTSISELKRRSRRTLSGNYNLAVGGAAIIGAILVVVYICLVFMIISVVIKREIEMGPGLGWDITTMEKPSFYIVSLVVGFVIVLFISFFQFGLFRMLLHMTTHQPFSLRDMVFAFSKRPSRFLGLFAICYGVGLVLSIPYSVLRYVSSATGHMPVIVVLEILMYLLLLVGSIVFRLNYGLAGILLVERPEKTVISCFRESRLLMKKNKGRMFYMMLSFIGMLLLVMGSFGIGMLWVLPYITETNIQFYLDIRAGIVLEDPPAREPASTYLNGKPYESAVDD